MSLQMRAVAAFMRATRKRQFMTTAGGHRMLDEPKGSGLPPARVRDRHDVRVRRVEGFDCWTLTPRGGGTGRAAVYLHGGTYVSEVSAFHWRLLSRLADAGVRVEVPLYGLAPQHTFHAAYTLVTQVYGDLVAEVEPADVTLAGDSAGGGLALGLAQTLAPAGLPLPGRLTLIAPWLDIGMTNPELDAAERHDPWLGRPAARVAAQAWAGGTDLADPRLSPLFGPLAGLPPVDVWIGTADMLLPDALELQRRAAAADVPLRLFRCPGAVHVHPLTPTPEGRTAAAQIVATIAGR